MWTALFLVSVVVAVAVAAPPNWLVENEKLADDLKDDVKLYWKKILSNDISIENESEKTTNVSLVGFTWKNCGAATDTIQVKAMALTPDPIPIPGEVKLSFDVNIANVIPSFTELDLVVKKKIFGIFVEVPCVDNLGSCNYKNPCDLLTKITCPPVFKEHGISCTCPVKKGDFKLPQSLITIPKIKLPSFIEDGEYEISATFKVGAKRMGCYTITASLKAS